MGDVVSNPLQFNRGLDAYVTRFERRFQNRMRMLVSEGMRRMLRRTPVHTGQAAMSYVASVGQPKSSSNSGYEAVESTNKLPLGAEVLRPRAEQRSLATIASVSFEDPFQVYWITNSAPHIGGLENGELPDDPYVPRSPQGMFGVTLQELTALLERSRL